MRRLQVGDEVFVIRGNYRSKPGRDKPRKIRRVLVDRDAVVVEGVNVRKRHVKSAPQRPGGIIEIEAPIHASKVMPVDPETGKRTRVRCKQDGDQKVRVAGSGATLPVKAQS
jgi:large subunit ribosomal protein L24